MDIIRSIEAMQQRARELRRAGHTIGLVPTMGYLHEGHLSLMRIARAQADVVIASVFVNPTQFGPNEDLDAYPRNFEQDERRCEAAGVDIVFYPTAEAMYAPDHTVYVVEDELAKGLCGMSRPIHFRGVLTVVSKLFNLCLPDVAVFGEKDAQQLRLIRRLVRDLNFPVHILPGPIVREPDGVAMSSRNANLDPGERKNATCLRRSLDLAETLFRDGERRTAPIRQAVRARIEQTPGATIDYIETVDDENLEPVEEIDRPCLVALAVNFSRARLLDNTVLNPNPEKGNPE
jgi:pantoate--beta-alanine ligase